MKYILPLKEDSYRRIVNMLEGNADFAMYKSNKVLYVLCHGSVSGLVQFAGQMMSLEELLLLLIKNGMANDDIITVRTISCYGAYQEYVNIDGITIGPEFAYRGMLDMNVHVDMQMNYTLEIEEYKSKWKTVV